MVRITHNLSGNRAYRIWCAVKQRCLNPNNRAYHYYGGRGITMCERWKNSFQSFVDDMGMPFDGGTLDRIDNEKGYFPENCRWASRSDQQKNRRNNKIITYNGVSMVAVDWAKKLGIPSQTIYGRISLGWDAEKVLSLDPQRNTIGLSLGGRANGERNKAKTHCPKGHEYTPENTFKNGNGRGCRRCKANRESRRYWERKNKQLSNPL